MRNELRYVDDDGDAILNNCLIIGCLLPDLDPKYVNGDICCLNVCSILDGHIYIDIDKKKKKILTKMKRRKLIK